MEVASDYVTRVRAARGALNMSLDEFAAEIGVGRSTLIRIEAGKREPKEHELLRMASASGLPVEFFEIEDLHEALANAREVPGLSEHVEALGHRLDALSAKLEQHIEATKIPPTETFEQLLVDLGLVKPPSPEATPESDPVQDHQDPAAGSAGA
jgi:transcriptional regulator with XRE-family HTH domain